MNFSKIISGELGKSLSGVEAALRLIDEGATIPFISRYRKEATGGLDDITLYAIEQRYQSLCELEKRKGTVLSTIESTGSLTPELRRRIEETVSATELEDIYLPFKPKKRTRASVARDKGLEPLARIIMAQREADVMSVAKRYITDEVPDVAAAIAGATDIIAEWVSESETARHAVRRIFQQSAEITVCVVKGQESDTRYADYHKYTSPLKRCPSHRYLAMRRGEREGILKVSINVDDERSLERLDKIFVKNNSVTAGYVQDAVRDGYKRLLRPSIENETASGAKAAADKIAIDVFAANLRQLLMGSPLGAKRVMGLDPGFRTGCKVVCLDAQGTLLCHDVIFPVPPKADITASAEKLKKLVGKYGIEAISLGNGTASRETEQFVRGIDWGGIAPKLYIVNEAGASVYSASEIARREFPDEDVTVRGAVSIGRRLLDPMAELVKIDPKSIGVGQYQHDVDQGLLKDSLDNVVESCVNSVGINLNTASVELLSYVSGIGPKLAQTIVEYRNEHGAFKSRDSLKSVPRLGDKIYTQAAGFLRVPESKNPLDNTGVHPERYSLVEKMATDEGCSIDEFIRRNEKRRDVDLNKYLGEDVGLPTLNDIMKELDKPGRDPRGEVDIVEFDSSIHDIVDLMPGMILPGIVNNITAFGAFVDIGVHQSGLVHISQLSDRFITHPSEAVSLGDHVMVKVLDVDHSRNRISLSIKQAK